MDYKALANIPIESTKRIKLPCTVQGEFTLHYGTFTPPGISGKTFKLFQYQENETEEVVSFYLRPHGMWNRTCRLECIASRRFTKVLEHFTQDELKMNKENLPNLYALIFDMGNSMKFTRSSDMKRIILYTDYPVPYPAKGLPKEIAGHLEEFLIKSCELHMEAGWIWEQGPIAERDLAKRKEVDRKAGRRMGIRAVSLAAKLLLGTSLGLEAIHALGDTADGAAEALGAADVDLPDTDVPDVGTDINTDIADQATPVADADMEVGADVPESTSTANDAVPITESNISGTPNIMPQTGASCWSGTSSQTLMYGNPFETPETKAFEMMHPETVESMKDFINPNHEAMEQANKEWLADIEHDRAELRHEMNNRGPLGSANWDKYDAAEATRSSAVNDYNNALARGDMDAADKAADIARKAQYDKEIANPNSANYVSDVDVRAGLK